MLLCALIACRPPGYGDPAPDATPDSPDARITPDAAPSPDATPISCDNTFRLEGYSTSTSVWVSGDFVGWAGTPADGALALTLGGDGAWTGTHTFAGGTYQYKLIIDGSTWIADPANPNTVPDGVGGSNSVYVCP